MTPIVQPEERWYQSLLQLLARKLPPLAAIMSNRARRLAAEAFAAYERGDLEQASARYSEAVDWQPGNAEYLANLGLILGQLGRFDDARQVFNVALFRHPDDKRALKGMALTLHQQNELRDAMYFYLRYADLEPDDGDVCYNLCAVFYELGRYDDAVEWSERALTLAPRDPLVLRIRVQALAAVGRLEETGPLLERAAKISPDDPQIDLLLGKTLDLLGQPEASLDAYRQAARKNPGNPEVHLEIARVAAFLGQYREAEKEANLAAAMFAEAGNDQGAAHSYWELGWCYYNLQEMQASVDASKHALQLDPSLAPAHFNLGLALLHLGRGEEARSAYEDGIAKVVEVSDLKIHAIDDLNAALKRNPGLEGATRILQALEQVYDALSRDLASADDESMRGTVAEPATASSAANP
jgi:tetratricopeptide (TPR) repeat protein